MDIAVLLVIALVVSRLIETDRQMAPLRGALLKPEEPAERPKKLREGAGWCGKGMEKPTQQQGLKECKEGRRDWEQWWGWVDRDRI